MASNVGFSHVGSFVSKYLEEESLGEIFIRRLLDNYLICVQDEKDKKLYKIVADCGNDERLANYLKTCIVENFSFLPGMAAKEMPFEG